MTLADIGFRLYLALMITVLYGLISSTLFEAAGKPPNFIRVSIVIGPLFLVCLAIVVVFILMILGVSYDQIKAVFVY